MEGRAVTAQRIVLVRTSHPGNIGAAARAMRTMGLTELVLVEPRAHPHAESVAMAAGADDVLDAATVCRTLDEAVATVGALARFAAGFFAAAFFSARARASRISPARIAPPVPRRRAANSTAMRPICAVPGA